MKQRLDPPFLYYYTKSEIRHVIGMAVLAGVCIGALVVSVIFAIVR